MMKQLFAAMLCLLLVCAASLCAAEIPEGVVLPLVESLAGAQKTDSFTGEGGTRLLTLYGSADEDALDEFLMMCPMCGVYPSAMEMAEGSVLEGYFLIQPGSAFDGYVLLDPAKEQLAVDIGLVTEKIYMLNESSAQTLRYMDNYDMKLPSGGGSAAPQFYAVVNRLPYFDGVMSAGFAFGGANCWTEMYDEVSSDDMGQYATIMGLFGFDVNVDLYDIDEEDRLNPVLLHFANGDADILVLYDALEGNATVYYEPGVTYNLLDGGDLNDILPQ